MVCLLGEPRDERKFLVVRADDFGGRVGLTAAKRFERRRLRVMSEEDEILGVLGVPAHFGHQTIGELSDFRLMPRPTFTAKDSHLEVAPIFGDLHCNEVHWMSPGLVVRL